MLGLEDRFTTGCIRSCGIRGDSPAGACEPPSGWRRGRRLLAVRHDIAASAWEALLKRRAQAWTGGVKVLDRPAPSEPPASAADGVDLRSTAKPWPELPSVALLGAGPQRGDGESARDHANVRTIRGARACCWTNPPEWLEVPRRSLIQNSTFRGHQRRARQPEERFCQPRMPARPCVSSIRPGWRQRDWSSLIHLPLPGDWQPAAAALRPAPWE